MAEPLPTQNQGEIDSEEELEAQRSPPPVIKKVNRQESEQRRYIHMKCPVEEKNIKKESWRDFYDRSYFLT